MRDLGELFELFDGRTCTLDGVHGRLVHRQVQCTYPYNRIDHRLYHVASPKGRQSAEYQAAKRRLGDDYDTDLTWSENLGEIARRCRISL